MRRGLMMALVPVVILAAVAIPALAGRSAKRSFTAELTGYSEVPAVSTTGTGTFDARVVGGDTIEFTLTYADLEGGEPQAAHIHLGQKDVNGGVIAFLCGGGSKPACPPAPATVTGTIVASDVIGPSGQGIAAGEIDEAIAALRAGVTYANVHTEAFPNGEIRGQIK
jgi:hypothetical protein